jgi:hypothetical protein
MQLFGCSGNGFFLESTSQGGSQKYERTAPKQQQKLVLGKNTLENFLFACFASAWSTHQKIALLVNF